jgi:glycosyltransferase involved in cell wall biosynthesis
VPTRWNKEMLEANGVIVPVHVMPLGVDPCAYRPMKYTSLPECELVTTSEAGRREVPKGFTFLYVFQPTFRKGVGFLARAFENAFANDPDAALVLGTTAYEPLVAGVRAEVRRFAKKARVYVMSGIFQEGDLAKIYNATQAFVCTSYGEGWNLPMCEAAACGKPVIIPRHTSHLDFIKNGDMFTVDPEGEHYPPDSGRICGWYDRVPFAKFGEKSHEQLVSILRDVRNNYISALERAKKFSDVVRTEHTWDNAAIKVLDRMASL